MDNVISRPSVLELTHLVQDRNFLILGEIHGIRENVWFTKSLLSALFLRHERLALGLEWFLPKKEQPLFDNYIQGRSSNLESLDFSSECKDGRMVLEHINLFRWIQKINLQSPNKIQVFCFDVPPSVTLERNVLMASAIKETHSLIQPDICLIQTGAVHAQKYDPEIYSTTIGSVLGAKQSLAVHIKYESGAVIVDGVVYPVAESATQQTTFDKHFDATVFFDKASPARSVSWQELKGML